VRIGIAGWFGSDNLGDEILLHSLIGCVRSVEASASFVVFAPNPGRVRQLHAVDAEHMPTLRSRGAAERQGAVQGALRGCDLLFLGPGTVFQERSPNLSWPGTLPLFARLVGMARLAGTPVAVAGAGVREGGTAVGRQLLRALGAACVAVGVRDQRSAAHFGRGAQVIGDLAYALKLPEVKSAKRDDRFAVSMRPLAPDTETSLLAAISGCVDRLGREGWSGAFLPMAYGRDAHGEDDRAIYDRAFADALDVVATPLDGDAPLAGALDEWLGTLATNRLVIATRLHAAVMAVALGVPTVAVAYERKVHDAFVDLNLERFVLGPDVGSETLHRAARLAAESTEDFQDAAARLASQGMVGQQFIASVLKGLG
jgi:polysaccharide pyruvyl transferase WcaK-like protein